jgi:putative nucleotidyltransferase with HDIG domain
MIVGHLSEAACDAIGANGLLARVACFYHDIGKIKNADYFAENFKPSDSPHSRLKPSMSGLIIRSHVKDTIEMLHAHGLPELVIDTATQHHGTTLIEYFYHKALEAKEPDEEVHEEDYRYGGPKPQTREAGIIMLADGVEAASRSLAETSEDRLTGVVQRVINNKFTDGQLDHCDLTLRDMHLIAKSFLQVLRGIYHQRPTYPWQHKRREETKRPNEDQKRESSTARLKAVERPAIANNSSTTEGEKATAKVLTHPQLKSQAKNEKKPKNDGKSDKDKDKDKKAKNPERIATPGIPAHKTKEENKSERENKRNDESSTFHAQSPGEKDSQELIDLGIAPEAPPESNADIKRLGLS